MDNMAIWSKFAETGKVEDYLVYRKSLQNKTKSNFGDIKDEDEYRGIDPQRTEYS
ncbi:MAG: hypothetical protein J1F37_01085 [Oscillospiraceae bacterium]|nr:hypothetical protein [Oscillospiraceae bacterium]